jgi:hypothetical protein
MKKKDVYIDYENICLNCKEKGFYFGYSFKTIEYKGKTVLDIPARYLNGPCLAFNYRGWPLLLTSVMNSHQVGAAPNEPVFAMINSKYGETLTKFTYIYLIQNNKALRRPPEELPVSEPKIMFYVDTYHYSNKPYILIYYTFRNLSGYSMDKLNFYQFYDFDIYGQDAYSQDIAHYDEKLETIFQYNVNEGLEKSLIAGVCSTTNFPPDHYEGNKSMDLLITLDRQNLRDVSDWGPDDCAIGLQWSQEKLNHEDLVIYPMAIVMGFGYEQFAANVALAKEQLANNLPKIKKSVDESSRQEIDPKLQKMSFSVTEWCKDK